MKRGRAEGQESINRNDIVGLATKSYGKVICHEYTKYDSTAGGTKLRHYYRCEKGNGWMDQIKTVRRSSIISALRKEKCI